MHGQTTCDTAEIANLVNTADMTKKPTVFQFDKRYPLPLKTQKSGTKVTVLLYGSIGSTQFNKFHSAILSLENLQFSVDYVLRHNYIPVADNRIGLSGYGVELDIKNLEYMNKDDAKVKKDAQTESQGSHEATKSDDSMNGFLFDKLKQLNPEVNERIDEFKKYLFESTLELAPLKAWQMQDLSLQAAQRIIESDPSDALTVLEDLSQNFPMRARTLSKIQVKTELKKAFRAQRSRLETFFEFFF